MHFWISALCDVTLCPVFSPRFVTAPSARSLRAFEMFWGSNNKPQSSLKILSNIFTGNCKQRVKYAYMDTHNFLCFGNLLWAENLKNVLWQRTSNISSFKQKFAPFLNSEFFLLNSVSPPSVQSSVSAIMRIFFSPWMSSRISTVSVFIPGFHPVVCNCFTTPPPVLPSPLMRKCWTGCVSMLTGPCDFFFCLLICDSSTSSWDVLPSNRPAPMPRSRLLLSL